MAVLHAGPGPGALPPFAPTSLLTEVAIDPFTAVGLVAAGALYVAGVRRLRRRGRRWSRARSASFAIGLALLAVATQSGLAAYERALFSAHVGQHLLLGMAGPFFLALGAPVTLALQASERDAQVRLLRWLRAKPVRWVTHPAAALGLFTVSLFALYFTPLYQLSLEDDLVHVAVHLHFVVAGSIFYWAVIGLDPVSWRLPFGLRLFLVVLTVPFHSILGLALLSADQPIADHPVPLEQPGAVHPIDDQRTGAGLMWAVGEVFGLATAGVVLVQWMRHEDRANRRREDAEDRRSPEAGTPRPGART